MCCIEAHVSGEPSRLGEASVAEDFSAHGVPPVYEVIAHTNMYWTWRSLPGRTASVAASASVRLAADD